MTRIAPTFRRLSKAGDIAVMPYLPVGFPDAQTARLLLPVIGRQGADLIALGTRASASLATPLASSAATLADCLSIAAEARRTNEVPLVMISTLEEANHFGMPALAAECAASGVDALLVLDLAPTDFPTFAAACVDAGIDPIAVVSQDISDPYLDLLDPASGFLYVPVTSISDLPSPDLQSRLAEHFELPLVLGFSPALLASEGAIHADGVLSTEGIADLILSHPEYEIMLEVSDHVRALKENLKPLVPES